MPYSYMFIYDLWIFIFFQLFWSMENLSLDLIVVPENRLSQKKQLNIIDSQLIANIRLLVALTNQ